jgi:hypothetical protein
LHGCSTAAGSRDFADYVCVAAASGAWPKPTTTRRSTNDRKPIA